MKTYFLLLVTVLISSSLLSQQSLKDSLFKGKLKNPLAETAAAQKDSLKAAEAKKDSVITAAGGNIPPTTTTSAGTPVTTTDPSLPPSEAVKADDTMPDSLNVTYYAKQKNWKRFIDQQTIILSSQADESKKVRIGEYYIEFDYTIGVNGRVKASNITMSPKNDFIMESITDILSRPPVMSPPIYADGKPRPITAKQQMTILKKK